MQINKDGLETNKIVIASTTTMDRLDKVYILFNSIKQTKQLETKIEYWLFVQGDINYCTKYFAPLSSDDFTIIYDNVDNFASAVHTPARDHVYYAKCLFPNYFIQYNKLLYLDVDIVFFQKGIEDLWNTNIDDYYLGACIDPTWQYCPNFKFDINNTRTNNYFNAGMMLYNLERIREEGKAEELQHWCLHWNLNELACNCFDQTLLNYILRDKVKILDFKYNNSLLSCLGIARNAYAQYLKEIGYDNPKDSLNDAVILHFCGANKPWHTNVNDSTFPYYLLASSIWNALDEKYRKQKIKIIQYFVNTNNEDYLKLAQKSEALNKKYAEIYDYVFEFTYIDEEEIIKCFEKCTGKEILMYKMKYIYDNLIKDDCDILVFIDADAVVSKPCLSIENMYDTQHELFLSRGNDIVFQIENLNNVYKELNRIFRTNILNNEFWSDVLKKENDKNLYGSLEVLSFCCNFHNEGFYIIKNTEQMISLFKDVLTTIELLKDSIYYSPVGVIGRSLCLCLLKEKYNNLFTFLPNYIQGAKMGAHQCKYDEEKTFILHEYGKKTNVSEKIREVEEVKNNKWWSKYLNEL